MSSREQQTEPRIIAVAGGKGGTGKTLLAANVGIFLATLGKNVVAVDASFGAPNLHAFCGVARPDRTLADMLGNRSVPLEHVAVETPIGNLRLIAGEGDPAWAANPKSAQINRLISQLRQLEADYVVLDLASGTSGNILDLFLVADVGVVTTVPEPTSVEGAYRFLRAAFVRRMRKVGVSGELEMPGEELRRYEGGIPAPGDLLAFAEDKASDMTERIAEELDAMRPYFVVNEVRSKADMELGQAVARAVRRRMSIPAGYMGHIEYDDAVSVAVRRRRPLLLEHPESRVARCIERAVRRLLAIDDDKFVHARGGDSYYDLLEIEPTATDEEIRRANRRIREIYARDSLVVGGLYNRRRLDDLHLRIDEAYETLMDAAARKNYDQALFPGGVPKSHATSDSGPSDLIIEATVGDEREQTPSEPVVEKPLPPMPDLEDVTDYTGSLMREVREARGMALRAISDRTKIGMTYLRAIEDEDFRRLPAVVYVRGFLVEYARMLDLDVDGVLGSYLPRYREARTQTDPELT